MDLHFQQFLTSTYDSKKLKNDQIFICTHGRHDKCCAKFGHKLAEKMRSHVIKQKLPIEIWESSHLGGHRFAATMIDFPSGFSYGSLNPDNVQDFLAYKRVNKIYASCYRGSVFLPELEKVAEAFAQHYCFEQKWSPKVKIINIEKIKKDKFSCVAVLDFFNNSFKSKPSFKRELCLSFVLKKFKNPSGCETIDEPELRKRWEIESLVPK